jgi:hypothetical protein
MKRSTSKVMIAAGVFVVAGAAAHAQIGACNSYCGRYESGQCVETVYESCPSHNTQPTNSFGAIAYGRGSRAYGYSYAWGSRTKAESVAMGNCKPHGNDCEIMVWFQRKCGAVSWGGGSTAYWGLGSSAAQAQADAQSKCAKDGRKNCQVQVSRCSL